MKQRITALDLLILARELEPEVLNYRLSNIYNVAANPNRQFLLRFTVPDLKKAMMLECGHRVHLTLYEMPTSPQPLNFITKLRKHLRTRRLTGIKQIGDDRVLVLSFSDGLFYLVLEFFSAGNILLLDENQKILMLNRVVREHENNDRYAVNEPYTMFDRHQLFGDTTPKQDDSADTETSTKPQAQFKSHPVPLAEQIQLWINEHKEKLSQGGLKKQKVYSVHKLLFVHMAHLPADLILRELGEIGIEKSTSCLTLDNQPQQLERVAEAVKRTNDIYTELMTEPSVTGYLVSKKNPSYNAEDSLSLEYILDEFHPFAPRKEPADLYKIEPVEGYNNTVDKFFSTLESLKNLVRIERQKLSAAKRLETARSERDRQIQLLLQQQEANKKRGDTIILHADWVSQCMDFVSSLVAQQMDWTNIESYIKLEQKKGNKVAQAIKLPLKLEENKIQLALADQDAEVENDTSSGVDDSETESELSELESESDLLDSDLDSDSDAELRLRRKRKATQKKSAKPQQPTVNVWVDINLSPYANATTYFETKKLAESKQVKVEKNTEVALKNAERKINQDLQRLLKEEEALGGKLRQIRPKYWFEKFFWFVSSDGYLCLAGKDGMQNDMIYFRHISDNDYFVSADVENSLKVFIKNPFKGEDVPPLTLMQAGMYALAASDAWQNKVSTLAWVMLVADLSKKDVDGTLLSPGSFNYTAKKEYLPPTQLVMGLGLYMLADEETKKKHHDKRVEKYAEHGLKVVMDTKKQDLEQLAKLKFKHEANPETKAETGAEGKETKPEESGDVDAKPEEVTDTAESVASTELTPVREDSPSTVEKKVRGKKAKLKKIQSKYADQDEEERRMRMEVLGTLKQVKQREAEKQAQQNQSDSLKQKQQQQQQAAQRKMKQDAKEYLKYIMAGDDTSDELSETNYLDILDGFLSKPQKGDKFIGCVPVFAPWMSLGKFKYKVKIQPGTGKKGKCITELIHHWTTRKMDKDETDTDLDWPSERHHVQGIKPNDAMGVITVSKVRLVLPGGSAGGDNKAKGNPKKAAKGGKPAKKKK